MEEKETDLPIVGFTVLFNNLGETYPLVNIAKKYIELGGKAMFFGYGDKYKDLAIDLGCKVVIFPDYLSEKTYNKNLIRLKKYNINKIKAEDFLLNTIDKDNFQNDINNIKNEIKAFKENNIQLVITGYNFRSNISARVLKIPLVYIISGAGINSYYKQNLAKFPDNYENFLTRILPGFLKNRVANWIILNSKSSVKEFNRLANEFNTPKIKHFTDLSLGDHTLIVEDISFLNMKPSAEFPKENFVGPIFQENIAVKNEELTELTIKKHLEKPGRSILVSLGSTITKKLFIDILRTLEKTDFNVVATYLKIFDQDEIEKFNDNILLMKFVPSIKKVNEMVDLVILHGGRGTIYTAAYSGKPVIGIPMMIEQQCNVDNLVRQGCAIRLSKKYFKTKDLQKAVDKIFRNYDIYYKNAQLLKEKLQEPKGAENTVKRLLEIIKSDNGLINK